ncbi:MAG: hypothetical protein KGJ23_08755 [Euryarchaeota archaeon]|nr:hypothetical protein [Euryarchaeota archaeon]MDE1836693.1 hypothetical protein [Euryarchaeota archaeon]MDE1880278.1 hypothetical protein [Euryarchaeota archaeon]MDE2044663.1 hypothetical protein [Thermoplasmata archaeon]
MPEPKPLSPYANRPVRPGGNAAGAAILTPQVLFDKLDEEFHFSHPLGKDGDPCPFPRPDGFDGTVVPWGPSSYVNPPFGPPGFTAWVKKALAEQAKGHDVVLTMPVYGWIARLLEADCEPRVRRDWWWETPNGVKKKPSQPLIVWVLRGRKVA